jgi:hypothetical protein
MIALPRIEIGPHNAEAFGSKPTSPWADGMGAAFPNNSSVVSGRLSSSDTVVILTLLAKDDCKEFIEEVNQQFFTKVWLSLLDN